MPVKVERLAGESIIIVTVNPPSRPAQDMPEMFGGIIRLRKEIQGDVAVIVDIRSVADGPDGFGTMVLSLSEASRGVKVSQEAGVVSPPIMIYVGSGFMATLIPQAMAQEQYGGVRGNLCSSLEEALALARAKLPKTEIKTE